MRRHVPLTAPASTAVAPPTIGPIRTRRVAAATATSATQQPAHGSGLPASPAPPACAWGGICLYPILDRPDWDDSTHWHNSGLWDLLPDASGTLQRVLDRPYAEALCRAPRLLPP